MLHHERMDCGIVPQGTEPIPFLRRLLRSMISDIYRMTQYVYCTYRGSFDIDNVYCFRKIVRTSLKSSEYQNADSVDELQNLGRGKIVLDRLIEQSVQGKYIHDSPYEEGMKPLRDRLIDPKGASSCK